jgi:hypothetical protein
MKGSRGQGPSLIECLTYRHSGHSRGDPAKYRPEGELDRWKQRDPIKIYRERLLQFGCGGRSDREHRRGSAKEWSMRRPKLARLRRCRRSISSTTDVYADGGWHGGTDLSRRGHPRHRPGDGARPDVVFLGEDVAKPGGVFKATVGLSEQFGPLRVRDYPISEQAILGAAMGAAMTGLKPIAEIMFSDFFAVCFDYIANEFPKSRYMSNGQVKCPLVVRTGNGAGSRFGASISRASRMVHDDPGPQGRCALEPARCDRADGGRGARSRSGDLF